MNKKQLNQYRQPHILRGSGDYVPITREFMPNAVRWGSGLLGNMRGEYSYDDSQLANIYAVSVTAWACTTLRAKTAGNIRLKVQTLDTDELLHTPADWLIANSKKLMNRIESSLTLWGRVFLLKERNKFGYPTRLKWLNNLDVTPIYNGDQTAVAGYRVINHPLEIAREDMIDFATFNPLSDTDGIAPYEVAFKIVEAEKTLVEYVLSYFANSARPDGLLTYEGDLDPEDEKQYAAQWRKIFQGARNAFRTFVASGNGRWNYTPLQSPPADLAMTDLKMIMRSDVCAVFGVNPVLIGIGASSDPLSAQSTHETITQRFLTDVMIPNVDFICEHLNEQWLHSDFSAAFGRFDIAPDTKDILSASKSSGDRANTASAAVNGRYWSINEARQFTGQDPLENVIDYDPAWALQVWQAGLITRNETRRAIGKNPLLGTKDGFIFDIDPRFKAQEQPPQPGPGLMSPNSPNSPGLPPGLGGNPSMPPLPPPPGLPGLLPLINPGDSGNLGGSPATQDTPKGDSGNRDSLEAAPGIDPAIRAQEIAQLNEIRQWSARVKKHGPAARFNAELLHPEVAGFIRKNLDEHWNPEVIFDHARDMVKSGNRAAPEIGASPQEADSYWQHYDKIKDHLGTAFINYMQGVAPAILKRFELEPNADIQDLLDKGHDYLINAWVGGAAKPGPLTAIMYAGGQAADHSLEMHSSADPLAAPETRDNSDQFPVIGVNFDQFPAWAHNFATNYSYDLITRIDRVTKDHINAVISDGIAKGLSMPAIADMLKGILSGETDTPSNWVNQRAEMIAQTEGMRAFNEGALDRWTSQGVQEATYQTVRDDHVCPICRPLHKTRAAIGEGWAVKTRDGVNYQTPPMHPRCRCFMRPVARVASKDYPKLPPLNLPKVPAEATGKIA